MKISVEFRPGWELLEKKILSLLGWDGVESSGLCRSNGYHRDDVLRAIRDWDDQIREICK